MTPNKFKLRANLAVVVAAVVLGLATLFGLAYAGGGLRFGSSYQIKALMPTAGALAPNARVTMAGADVGRVASIKQQGLGALVALTIDNSSVTPIPTGSQVQLREVTPVGENYVEIIPSSARTTLPSGSVLPMSQAGAYVDVDQLLSVLQGGTREHARQLFQSFGGALQGHAEQLNNTLGGVTQTFVPLAHIVNTLHRDRTQVSRLVAQLGDLASAVGERGASLMQIGRDGLTTFNAIAARDNALRAFLDQLPSTLAQVRASSLTLNSVTNTAAPVLANLAAALQELQPAARALTPAAQEGRQVMHELGAAAPGLTTTLSNVSKLSGPATSAIPQLHLMLCQANPMLRYAVPYTGDLISFLSSFGSAVNAYDRIGHVVRIVGIYGDNSASGLPANVSQAAFTLLHSGFFANSTALNWDPYPKPGMIGKESASGTNQIIGPAQLATSGYRYPHVVADC